MSPRRSFDEVSSNRSVSSAGSFRTLRTYQLAVFAGCGHCRSPTKCQMPFFKKITRLSPFRQSSQIVTLPSKLTLMPNLGCCVALQRPVERVIGEIRAHSQLIPNLGGSVSTQRPETCTTGYLCARNNQPVSRKQRFCELFSERNV